MSDKIEARYAELDQLTRDFLELINRRNSELEAELKGRASRNLYCQSANGGYMESAKYNAK